MQHLNGNAQNQNIDNKNSDMEFYVQELKKANEENKKLRIQQEKAEERKDKEKTSILKKSQESLLNTIDKTNQNLIRTTSDVFSDELESLKVALSFGKTLLNPLAKMLTPVLKPLKPLVEPVKNFFKNNIDPAEQLAKNLYDNDISKKDKENLSKAQLDMATKASKPGSIYTHDIRLEKLFSNFTKSSLDFYEHEKKSTIFDSINSNIISLKDSVKNSFKKPDGLQDKKGVFKSMDESLFMIRNALASSTSTFFARLFEPITKVWNTWFFGKKDSSEIQIDRLSDIKNILIKTNALNDKNYKESSHNTKILGSILTAPFVISKKMISLFSKKKKDEENEENQLEILTDIKTGIFSLTNFNEDERKRLLRQTVPKEEKSGFGIKELLLGAAGVISAVVVKVVKEIKDFLSGFNKISSLFSKIGDSKFFKGISGFFSKTGKLFGKIFDIGGIFSKTFKIVSKLLSGLRVVPILGWIISLIDFFKGFFSADGNFIDKLAAGVKNVVSSFIDGLLGIPLNILEWIVTKTADLFDVSVESGWADEVTNWVKSFFTDAVDWFLAPLSALWDMLFGEDKTPDMSIFDKLINFFDNFWSNVINWMKKNPIMKTLNWLWNKITGEPIFDDVKINVDNKPTKNVAIQKTTSSNNFNSVDMQAKKAKEEKVAKTENTSQALTGIPGAIAELSEKLSAGVGNAITETTNKVSEVFASVTQTNNEKSKAEIPEGIESLGLMMKNSTWGW